MKRLDSYAIELALRIDAMRTHDELSLYKSDLLALLDREDYERLVQYRWTLKKGRKTNYAIRHIGESTYEYMHHAVIGQVPRLPYVVDHINANGLDNRRGNLQVITNADNIRRAARPNAGVYYTPRNKRNPWRAEVSVDYTTVHIGYYPTEAEAIEARKLYMHEKNIGGTS